MRLEVDGEEVSFEAGTSWPSGGARDLGENARTTLLIRLDGASSDDIDNTIPTAAHSTIPTNRNVPQIQESIRSNYSLLSSV